MAKNEKYSEPPIFKGDVEKWIQETADYLRALHQSTYGLGGDGGELDGIDNIVSASDPGVADGTEAGNATVINQLTANLKATGIVEV